MSGPVVQGNSGSAFAQQGQVDWVAFSQGNLNFSVQLLARWSKAGIEPLTIAMGRLIGHRFLLPPETQQRLDKALASLATFRAIGKVLSFGFGIRHVVDNLRDTEQGAALIILCACLSTTYPTFFCAQVLRELCRASGAPQDLTPALSQWTALIEVCSGVLAKTKFPLLVQGLERYICPIPKRGCRFVQYPTDAEALANALINLSSISTGSMMGAVFTGGVDCAWIASLALWMLGLTVEIVDPSGNVIYQGGMLQSQHKSLADSQVTILLNSTGEGETSLLRSPHKLFRIPHGEKLLFGYRSSLERNDSYYKPINQTSSWSHILKDTFGSDSKALLESAEHFGHFLLVISRCAERAQHAEHNRALIYKLDFNVRARLSSPWNYPLWIHKKSKGRPFLHFATERLPELRQCVDFALSAEAKDEYMDAKYSRDLAEERLHQICPCSRCKDRHKNIPRLYEPCLIHVAETIISYLWLLVPAIIDESVLPSRTGLSQLIRTFAYRFSQEKSYSAIWEIPDRDPEESVALKNIDYVPALFCTLTGLSQAPGGSPRRSAVAGNGLCIYYQGFTSLDQPPSDACSINVIPGHIEYHSRLYRAITDMIYEGNREACSTVRSKLNGSLIWDLIIQETEFSDCLQAAVTCRDSNSSFVVFLTLCYFVRRLGQCLFQVDCRDCRPEKTALVDGKIVSWSLQSSSLGESSGVTIGCRAPIWEGCPWTLIGDESSPDAGLHLNIRFLNYPQFYRDFMVNGSILSQCCGCLVCMVDILAFHTEEKVKRGDHKKASPFSDQANGKIRIFPLEGPPQEIEFKLSVKQIEETSIESIQQGAATPGGATHERARGWPTMSTSRASQPVPSDLVMIFS